MHRRKMNEPAMCWCHLQNPSYFQKSTEALFLECWSSTLPKFGLFSSLSSWCLTWYLLTNWGAGLCFFKLASLSCSWWNDLVQEDQIWVRLQEGHHYLAAWSHLWDHRSLFTRFWLCSACNLVFCLKQIVHQIKVSKYGECVFNFAWRLPDVGSLLQL